MNRLKISFHSIPTSGTIMQKGIAVKTFKIKDHMELINGIIDNTEGTIFEQLKLKRTINNVLDKFQAKTITIVEKEK